MYTDVRLMSHQHLMAQHQAFQDQPFQHYAQIAPSINLAFPPHQQNLQAPAPYPTGPTFGYPSPTYNSASSIASQTQSVPPPYTIGAFDGGHAMGQTRNPYMDLPNGSFLSQQPAFSHPQGGFPQHPRTAGVMSGPVYCHPPASSGPPALFGGHASGMASAVGGNGREFFNQNVMIGQSTQEQMRLMPPTSRIHNHEADARKRHRDRRSNSPTKSRTESRPQRQHKVEPKRNFTPWLIGQRVVVKVDGVKRFGTIKDYKPRSDRSHVWFDDSGTDDLLLNKSSLEFVYLNDRLPEAPKYEWKPATWARTKGTPVQVKYEETNEWYVGRIDGYDPASRRSHIVYSRETTEWAWATGKKIRRYSGEVAGYIPSDSVAPPPPVFDPIAYGLPDPASKDPNGKGNKRQSRAVVDLTSDNSPSPDSSHLRRSYDPDDSTSAGKRAGVKRSFINLAEDDDDDAPEAPPRKKIKLRKSCAVPHRHEKFPCHAKINGRKWKRHHAADEKKYFWVTEDSESQITSWNPWIRSDRQAPWQKKLSYWEKFADEDGQAYYHNFKTNDTLGEKPAEYYSAGEIYDDSCDEDYIKEKEKARAHRRHTRKSKSERKREYERNKRHMTPTALPTATEAKTDEFQAELTKITESLEDVGDNDGQNAEQAQMERFWADKIWSKMEDDLKSDGRLSFNDLFAHHSKGLALSPNVETIVMQTYIAKEPLYRTLHASANEWVQLEMNLQSKFTHKLREALRFLLLIASTDDDERFAKCFSLMSENLEHVTRMFEKLREGSGCRNLSKFVDCMVRKVHYRVKLKQVLKAHVCRDWINFLFSNGHIREALSLIKNVASISPYFQVPCVQRHVTNEFSQLISDERRDTFAEATAFLEAIRSVTMGTDTIECATPPDGDSAIHFGMEALFVAMKKLLLALIPRRKSIDAAETGDSLSEVERQVIVLCCQVLQNLFNLDFPQWFRKTHLNGRADRIAQFFRGDDRSSETSDPSLALCLLRFVNSRDSKITASIIRVFRLTLYSNGFINVSDYFYEYQKDTGSGPNNRQGLDWIQNQLLFTYNDKNVRRLNPKFNYQYRRRQRAALLLALMFEPIPDHPQTVVLNAIADRFIEGPGHHIDRWGSFFKRLRQLKESTNREDWRRLYEANEALINAMPCESRMKPWHKSLSDICKDCEKPLKLVNRLRNNMKIAARFCADFDHRLSDIVSLLFRGRVFHHLLGIFHMDIWDNTKHTAKRACSAIYRIMTPTEKQYVSNCQLPFPNPQAWHRDEDTALRQGLALRRVSKYHSDKSILVCGDGDLTFGRALCRKFGLFSTEAALMKMKADGRVPTAFDYGSRHVVVSCYESAIELLKLYPKSGSVVHEIRSRGGYVLFGIDATSLQQTLRCAANYHKDIRPFPVFDNEDALVSKRWDVIVWNFPHAFADNHIPRVNGELVRKFFESAIRVLAPNGEIHVSFHINQHITEGFEIHQYTKWDIPQHARHCGLRKTDDFEFLPDQFSGYAVKNVSGNPFNILKAQTYVFKMAH